MKSNKYAQKKLENINPHELIIQQHQEFIQELKSELYCVGEIDAVILFGSYARGDYSLRHSDIDVMIFVDTLKKNVSFEEKIRKKIIHLHLGKELSPHILFQYKKVAEEDKSLLLTVAREGKVLFTKKMIILSDTLLGLKPYILLKFNTARCASVVKNKLQRFLYGYTIKKKHYAGLVDEEQVLSAGKAAIFVPEDISKKVLFYAQKIGVKVTHKGRFYH